MGRAVAVEKFGGLIRQCFLNLFVCASEITQAAGFEADSGFKHFAGGIEHHEAVTAAGTTAAAASGAWARCGGFEGLRRVHPGLDRLLQLSYFVARADDLLSSLSVLRREAGVRLTPLAVATQVQGASVSQFECDHATVAGENLLALEESVAFNQQASSAIGRNGEDLANNALDGRNDTAHRMTLLEMVLNVPFVVPAFLWSGARLARCVVDV